MRRYAGKKMDAERGKSGKCSPTDKSPKVQGRKHVVIIDIVYISMDKLACLYLLGLRVCVYIYMNCMSLKSCVLMLAFLNLSRPAL